MAVVESATQDAIKSNAFERYAFERFERATRSYFSTECLRRSLSPRLGKEILRWQEIITSADPDAQSTLTVAISIGHKHIGVTTRYNFRYYCRYL